MGVLKKINNFLKNLKFNQNIPLKHISNKKILITGTNSGIGLELTKKLLENNEVFSIYNNDSTNLDEIKKKNFHKIQCNLANDNDIEKLREIFKDNDIDILINNASIFGPHDQQSLENINFEDFYDAFKINSLSILKLTKIILENKNSSLKKIINISSAMGSITKNETGNYYIYRTTKTALNSISKNLSIDLSRHNIIVASIHPGSVKSKMNPSGTIEPNICAKQIINFIIDCNESLNGTFIDLQTLKKIEW
tara:strand:+ start:235 stop:990 length:756 start_codon:yes stop_codon:yes gene_type:complete